VPQSTKPPAGLETLSASPTKVREGLRLPSGKILVYGGPTRRSKTRLAVDPKTGLVTAADDSKSGTTSETPQPASK
jgi:hypothetical protein